MHTLIKSVPLLVALVYGPAQTSVAPDVALQKSAKTAASAYVDPDATVLSAYLDVGASVSNAAFLGNAMSGVSAAEFADVGSADAMARMFDPAAAGHGIATPRDNQSAVAAASAAMPMQFSDDQEQNDELRQFSRAADFRPVGALSLQGSQMRAGGFGSSALSTGGATLSAGESVRALPNQLTSAGDAADPFAALVTDNSRQAGVSGRIDDASALPAPALVTSTSSVRFTADLPGNVSARAPQVPVPEPTMLLLYACGLFGLVILRRKPFDM